MKELKYFHAVGCTCDKTGLIGDFIVDQEYYKETGKLAALDGKVFIGLVEMFRYANENGLKTGKINSNVNKPTYWKSKEEIKQALQQGKNVCWQNEGYKVSHAQNGLHITFKYSGYYSKLQDSEIKDCFIGV